MLENNFFAIIPMKEHSERVPNKNIREFFGKPLFYWIINTLTQIEKIEKIIIDTDSEKIANMVTDYFDVEISIRPKELRGDFVSVNKLIGYILNKFSKQELFLQTHSTNPLLKKETIEKALKFYLNNKDKYDSVFSVNRFHSRFYDKRGKPINHNPAELLRTQDLPPLFEENSNFYIFSKASFLKTKARIGVIPFMFETDKLESIDIDTIEDFRLAELIMITRDKDEG